MFTVGLFRVGGLHRGRDFAPVRDFQHAKRRNKLDNVLVPCLPAREMSSRGGNYLKGCSEAVQKTGLLSRNSNKVTIVGNFIYTNN